MKKNFKTLRMALLLVLCLAFTAIPGMASAETKQENVTGLIQTAETSLNYTFSPTITLTQSPETDVLTISDLTIENNQGVGRIKLEGLVKDKTVNGWKLEASDTNFKDLPLNSRKFSLVASIDGKTCDMSKGALSLVNKYIDAKEKAVIEFSGKASGSTYTKGERAIIMILTVAPQSEERYTKMCVDLCYYTIDYDMTWGQWLESELSTNSGFEISDGFVKVKGGDNYVYYQSTSQYQKATDLILPGVSYSLRTKD